MQESDSTTYTLITYASEGAQSTFVCSAADGYTDAFMVSFAQAVKALPWPAGQRPTISLSKDVTDSQHFTVDLTATTPIFT